MRTACAIAVTALVLERLHTLNRRPAGTSSPTVSRSTPATSVSPPTPLRYHGLAGGTGEVNFESDLGLDEQVNTFWVDRTWSVGRRHQLKLAFTRLKRDRARTTRSPATSSGAARPTAPASAQPRPTPSTFSGATIDSRSTATTASRSVRRSASATCRSTLAFAPPARWAGPAGRRAGRSRPADEHRQRHRRSRRLRERLPAKRLVLQGDFPLHQGRARELGSVVTDWRLAADYYFPHHVGVGVQYKYNDYRYDRGLLLSELGGEMTVDGFQIFGSFLFWPVRPAHPGVLPRD